MTDQRNRADALQLEKLQDSFEELIRYLKETRERPPTNVEGEENLRSRLLLANLIVGGIQTLVASRKSFLEKNPETKDFWTDKAQEILEDTIELFEEHAETLALGLNSAFHDEIDSARKESGIDSHAKADLPTR